MKSLKFFKGYQWCLVFDEKANRFCWICTSALMKHACNDNSAQHVPAALTKTRAPKSRVRKAANLAVKPVAAPTLLVEIAELL